MQNLNETPAAPDGSAPTPDPAEEPRLGAAARLWTAYFSPGEVFADIRRKPTWVLALVLMILLGVGANLAITPHIDTHATLVEQLGDRAGEMSADQIDAMVEQGEKFAKLGPLFGLVFGVIGWAAMAAVFFLLLKLVGSDTDFVRTLSTALHAYWPPTLIQVVLMSVLVQRMGKITQSETGDIVKSHLGFLVANRGPDWLEAVASTFSVFNVWAVILLVIGFATVGKVSKGKAAVVVAIPWLLWILGKAALAMVF